jgi:fluoride exporter
MEDMSVLAQVALGGAIGASLRHLIGGLMTRHLGNAFPWGTLTCNVVGSFAMGLAVMLLVRRLDPSLDHLAPFVMTGVLGGFTTFSAFSLETFLLIERGEIGLALAYVGVSVVSGLAAFALAMALVPARGGA